VSDKKLNYRVILPGIEITKIKGGMYYTHSTIVNDASRVVSERRSKLWRRLQSKLMTLVKAKATAQIIVQTSLMIVTYDCHYIRTTGF
jgi:hypothetical protein